jgi:hypothetical protein
MNNGLHPSILKLLMSQQPELPIPAAGNEYL